MSHVRQKLERIFGRPWFWVVVVGALFLAPIAGALSRELPEPPPVLLTLPDFRLTNHHGQPFGTTELRGKVWVAGFMFTSCPSVCPRLTEKMAKVQHRARNVGQAFHMVSFTVDPENDTPEKLAAYAKRFRASNARWSFVTGDLGVIEHTVVDGFKLAMGKDADNLFQIFHSERLVLIDGEGRIRGYYEADDAGIDQLMRDIGLVVNFG